MITWLQKKTNKADDDRNESKIKVNKRFQQMLKAICSYWQMQKQTNIFDAFLFDRRVYDVIEMKKMRKTSSIKDKQVKKRRRRKFVIV